MTPPRLCSECKVGQIISTKRYGEKIFTDKCNNCGKVYAEYSVETRN